MASTLVESHFFFGYFAAVQQHMVVKLSVWLPYGTAAAFLFFCFFFLIFPCSVVFTKAIK
jgi:hypothetical protein